MISYQNSQSMNQEWSADSSFVWGKLVSLNPNLPNLNLTKNVYKFGRQESNDVCIDDIRISGVHCILKLNSKGQAFIEDTSSNGTYIENVKVGKKNTKEIVSGKTFYLLHSSKVAKPEDSLGYVISLNNQEFNHLKREKVEQKREEVFSFANKILKPSNASEFDDSMRCKLCEDCIYKCVTAVPCLHNFCAACYSGWMDRSSLCPECEREVSEIKKNAFIDNMIQTFLEKNPQLKRARSDYQEMDQKNKILHNRLILTKKIQKDKRNEFFSASQEGQKIESSLQKIQGNFDMRRNIPTSDMEKKWMRYYELFHRFTSE